MTALVDETMAVAGGQWEASSQPGRVFCELPDGVEGEGAALLLGVRSAARTGEDPAALMARVAALWESRGYVVRLSADEAFGRAPDGGSVSLLIGPPDGRMALSGEGACRLRPPP